MPQNLPAFGLLKLTAKICVVALTLLYPLTLFGSVDAERLRAKEQLNSGEVRDGIRKLVELSDAGDNDSSFILGIVFLKSKISEIPRNEAAAEKFLLRGAANCHINSLKALNGLIYRKRGSARFNPAKASVLERRCRADHNLEGNEPNQAPAVVPPSQAKPSLNKEEQITPSMENDVGLLPDNAQITSDVKAAWHSIEPSTFDWLGHGSGVAISKNGVFLTNHHVVEECKRIAILYNELFGEARVIFANEDLDLAALLVDAPTPRFAAFDLSPLRLGERLIALGYPELGLFGIEPSFSEGRLTNTSDEKSFVRKPGFLLVSLPIASGNSGGPVYNDRGLLRGIVSYGIDNNELSDILNEDGERSFIDTVNFNFIVSGLNITKRLSERNVRFSASKQPPSRLEVEDVVSQGKGALALVGCGR